MQRIANERFATMTRESNMRSSSTNKVSRKYGSSVERLTTANTLHQTDGPRNQRETSVSRAYKKKLDIDEDSSFSNKSENSKRKGRSTETRSMKPRTLPVKSYLRD